MNTMPFALKASMAGFSLLYAVCVSFFYVNLLPGMSTETTLAFESALNGAMVAGCVALAVFAAKSPRAAHADFPLMGAGHLFMLLALIALFAPGAPYLGVGHLATSGALAGLGMACAVPYYFALLAPYKRKIATYACGIVFLVGMALNIVVAMLPDSVAGVCLIAALMGSAACLYAVRRDRRANMRACEDECEGERGFGGEGAALLPNAHERSAMQGSGTSGACAISPEAGASTRASWRDLLNVFLVPVVCTFALSVVYRIIDVAAVGMGQPSAVATLVSQCGGVVAALVFLMYFSLRKNTSMSLLFNAVFGILATGILLLPFLPDQYTAFLNACAAAGWKPL